MTRARAWRRPAAFALLLAASCGALALVPTRAGAQGVATPPRLVGVYDRDSDEPVAGVDIELLGTDHQWRTGQAGLAALTNAPAGRYLLRARRMGYLMHLQVITFSPADTVPVTIILQGAATRLPEVRVEAERSREVVKLTENGFFQRRQSSPAPPSAFWTREDFERIKAVHWRQVFTRVLGGRVDAADSLRLRCGSPMIILDGLPLIDLTIGEIPLEQVAGVEFYSSPAQVPVEFNQTAASGSRGRDVSGGPLAGFHNKFNSGMRTGNPGCVAVVWTR